jgi:hypothetical protein
VHHAYRRPAEHQDRIARELRLADAGFVMPPCFLCGGLVEDLKHPTLEPEPQYACRGCFDRMAERLNEARREEQRERMRCTGCGAAWGGGCECRSNKLDIARGERAKCSREDSAT